MNQQFKEFSGGTSTVLIGADLAYKNVRDPEILRNERAILTALIGTKGIPEIQLDHSPHRITMNRVPGLALSTILTSANLPREQGTKIMLSLASILAVIHLTHGVIHNDLCPDNTFYHQESNQAHIIDFGAASFINTPISQALRTQGKLEFFSPEKFDHRLTFGLPNDIFSLGVLFYFISEGCKPFPLEIGSISKQILNDTPLFPDMYSSEVGNLLMSMLEKTPENRPNASEVTNTLKNIIV